MSNSDILIFTIPLLMHRWQMPAEQVISKLDSQWRSIYIWLKGEFIMEGHHSSPDADHETINKNFASLKKHGYTLKDCKQYQCESYEKIFNLSKCAIEQQHIHIKDLFKSEKGTFGHIFEYRTLLNLKKISLNNFFLLCRRYRSI
jgi:hypothetical protein